MRDADEAVEFFLDIENFERVEIFIVGYFNSSSRVSGICTDIGHFCDRFSEYF